MRLGMAAYYLSLPIELVWRVVVLVLGMLEPGTQSLRFLVRLIPQLDHLVLAESVLVLVGNKTGRRLSLLLRRILPWTSWVPLRRGAVPVLLVVDRVLAH